jgi:hypothetical protein
MWRVQERIEQEGKLVDLKKENERGKRIGEGRGLTDGLAAHRLAAKR